MVPGDEIWEHKKGRVWRLVERLTVENRGLRYQNRVLQARLRGLGCAVSPSDATNVCSGAPGTPRAERANERVAQAAGR